jgi:hypothetical protein
MSRFPRVQISEKKLNHWIKDGQATASHSVIAQHLGCSKALIQSVLKKRGIRPADRKDRHVHYPTRIGKLPSAPLTVYADYIRAVIKV